MRLAAPMGAAVARFASAGLLLGGTEIAWVLLRDRRMFLSGDELLRYAAVALPLCVALTTWCGTVASLLLYLSRRGAAPARWPRRLSTLVFGVSMPAAVAVLFLLSEGRRARQIEGRWLWILGLAVASALLLAWLARLVWRLGQASHSRAGRRFGVGFGLLAAALVMADASVLKRLYPTFHWALTAQAVLFSLLAARMLWSGETRRRFRIALGLGCVAAAPLAVVQLADAPNLRFAVQEAAPITGKFLRMVPAAPLPPASAPEAAAEPQPRGPGIELAGKDVLLITVDALRADRLSAYGGRGLTPHMDALAASAMVFERAYSVTPHTSYSIASLMTGKYLREVMALPDAPSEQVTLAALLRRHGYRTAAFYPPAVFYVNEQRFTQFERSRFDFEYSKQMFARAPRRVRQVEDYLAAAAPDHPLFVWVHFFEPHEPYEPPAEFARGDSPEQRYDGEVAAVDAAVGRLVEVFRAARAGATVILTADHGEEFGEHGGYHHGTTLYDEQVRVPLLWSSPGGVAPGRSAAPVETIDVTVTLLSALGIPRDVRMRGDDLGPLLRGEAPADTWRAFASIGDMRMVVQGTTKAICRDMGGCRLFDTEAGEQRPVAADARLMATLQGHISRFVASISKYEAMQMDDGAGWPEALVRARLGDSAAASELAPLLGAARPAVRADAARYLGHYGVTAELPALTRLRDSDPDAGARAEACVAALLLGDADAVAPVRELLRSDPDIARRAAFALAAREDDSGRDVLVELALDEQAEERDRKQALVALRGIADPSTATKLHPLLDVVRLRVDTAVTLGKIGGARAARRLSQALETERYPEARRAELEALLDLGDRQVVRWVRRYLGTEIGLPGGVALLWRLGVLEKPSGLGGLLNEQPGLRVGSWDCTPLPCSPGEGARIRLPGRSPRGPVRVVLWLSVRQAAGPASIRLWDQRFDLEAGDRQVSLLRPERLQEIPVTASPRVGVLGVAVVPAAEDPPPPAPEPWDGGVPDAAVP